MPRIAVKIKPDGSFGPEWIHFAITPATKPMMIVQNMCSTCSLLHVLRRRCRTQVHVGRKSLSSRLTSSSVRQQEAGHGGTEDVLPDRTATSTGRRLLALSTRCGGLIAGPERVSSGTRHPAPSVDGLRAYT